MLSGKIKNKKMWPEFFLFNVSRESIEKLEAYHALLLKWQKAINLVSPKTVDKARERHFADSVQLEQFICQETPENVSRESSIVFDLGSGAGFPGLVLAMLRPDLEVHLIESDERKCEFLRTVSRETDITVKVHTQRIEEGIEGVIPDFVTARALADLSVLMGFCQGWAEVNPNLTMLFLKGSKADLEIADAKKLYSFDVQKHTSLTDPRGSILEIKNLARK